ncbi:MAG: hypothetical protein WBR26_23460 [Candidatus Acidiferrum sp.]
MRKIMLLLLVCAAPVYGQSAITDFRTGAGCGPQKTQYEVTLATPEQGVIAPSPGKARVYVIEIVGTNNTGATTRIGVDGQWVGANTGKGYMSFEVEPGDHHICADWQSILKVRQQDGAAMVMTAEAGRAYYFVVGILIQALDFNLTEVDQAEGQWLLSISQKSQWTQKKK